MRKKNTFVVIEVHVGKDYSVDCNMVGIYSNKETAIDTAITSCANWYDMSRDDARKSLKINDDRDDYFDASCKGYRIFGRKKKEA